MDSLWLLLLLLIVLIFPLYLTVKLLGGKITLLTAFAIKILAFLLAIVVTVAFGGIGPILMAIMLIIVYRFAFRIGIIRAFLAWLVEGFMLLALLFVLSNMGIATAKLSTIAGSFQHLTALL